MSFTKIHGKTKKFQIPSWKKTKRKEIWLRHTKKERQINHKWHKTKIWIATDADKNDAIFECIKKLNVSLSSQKPKSRI